MFAIRHIKIGWAFFVFCFFFIRKQHAPVSLTTCPPSSQTANKKNKKREVDDGLPNWYSRWYDSADPKPNLKPTYILYSLSHSKLRIDRNLALDYNTNNVIIENGEIQMYKQNEMERMWKKGEKRIIKHQKRNEEKRTEKSTSEMNGQKIGWISHSMYSNSYCSH